jgi:hypothetical protein
MSYSTLKSTIASRILTPTGGASRTVLKPRPSDKQITSYVSGLAWHLNYVDGRDTKGEK